MSHLGHTQPPANAISAWLARGEAFLVTISGVAMAAIMLIVVLDVVMRYAFDAPLAWSYDLIGLYLVGAVFFSALSDTMQNHGHIALDVFAPYIPRRLHHVALCLGFLASAALVAAIAWLEYEQAYKAFVRDDRIASVVPLQTWVAHAVLSVGMAMLTLRCAYRALFHLLSVFFAEDLVEMPPPPVTSQHAAEHGE